MSCDRSVPISPPRGSAGFVSVPHPYDTLGCYGNPFTHTPHLDRLAGRGALFECAFSQSPVCTPSRAAFLSGRYPRTCRARQNGADIPEDQVLVTRLMAEAGYVCGLSGKLHLSACNPSVCEEMERRIDDGHSVERCCLRRDQDRDAAPSLQPHGVDRGSPSDAPGGMVGCREVELWISDVARCCQVSWEGHARSWSLNYDRNRREPGVSYVQRQRCSKQDRTAATKRSLCGGGGRSRLQEGDR